MTTKVRVLDDVYTSLTREPNDDGWDRGDSDQSHNIRGIEVVDGYYDLEVGFEVEPGKDYWLLYGIYSTGDSFGHDEGRIQFVDLYEDREIADENAKRLRKHFDKGGSYSCKLKHESGKTYDFHTPWVGYFERLSWLEVQAVRIGSSRY